MSGTTTIVVTQNADNSINVASTDALSWGVYVPAGSAQIKRILFAIKSLLEVDLGIT